MRVVEMFYSLQGEGYYTGMPSVFIRFGGCNLRCPGFGGQCDSYYAVDSSYRDQWHSYDAASLIHAYESLKKTEHAHVVLTGGEPTLLFHDPQMCDFCAYLFKRDIRVSVETNATVAIDFLNPVYRAFTYALSVKLQNSGEAREKRINKETLASYLSLPHRFLKFVLDEKSIANGDAKREIDDLRSHFSIDAHDIFCMPLGATEVELKQHAPSVFSFCLEHGYRYSDRVHIRLFGNTRGV